MSSTEAKITFKGFDFNFLLMNLEFIEIVWFAGIFLTGLLGLKGSACVVFDFIISDDVV